MALNEIRITNQLPRSSSSPRYSWTYDVFISFRGDDTRCAFVSHLDTALIRAKLKVFKDERTIRMGRQIMHTIFDAIEESRISIVVFSPNFGESESCLDELVKIIECSQSKGRYVYPVFYHVSPTEVKHQTGCFQEGFAVHQNHVKLADWTNALAVAASRKGIEVKGNESECIENIVKTVLTELGPRRFAFGSLIPKGSACCSLSFLKRQSRKAAKTVGPAYTSLIDERPNVAHTNIYDKLYESVHIRLLNKTVVAILNVSALSQSDSDFLNEVSIRSSLKHENVAKLFGYCIKDSSRFLVEEHAISGTLHQLLHGASSLVPTLTQRVTIAYDVAKGLEYLHDQDRLGHVDSINVFLFRYLKAKISTGSVHREIYRAPEYNEGELTTEGDVYSFGILLLELLTGRNPSEETMDPVLPKLTVDNVGAFVDPKVKRNKKSLQARKLAWTILMTTRKEPSTRPNMNTIVQYLKKVTEV